MKGLRSKPIMRVPFKTKCFLELTWHLLNNIKMQAVISHRRFWTSEMVDRSWIMSIFGVCEVVAKSCFSWTNLRGGGAAVLRFQRRDWISLYGFSFNLATLERLCCHAVRYFHPPAHFLNSETVPRTFHISDFCRDRSRIARDLLPVDIRLPIYLPSSLSNIAIPMKILAIQPRATQFFFFLRHFPFGESNDAVIEKFKRKVIQGSLISDEFSDIFDSLRRKEVFFFLYYFIQ